MGYAKSKGEVYKYDLQGNFVAEYKHIQECCFMNGLTHTNLLNHIRGEFRTYKNNIYTKTYYIKLPDEILNRKKKQRKTKKVYQYDINGNYIGEFKSSKDAATFFNGTYVSINECIKGKLKSAYGYQWSHVKKSKVKPIEYIKKSVSVTDLTGRIIARFESQHECARQLNLKISTLRSRINKNKSYNEMYFINKY